MGCTWAWQAQETPVFSERGKTLAAFFVDLTFRPCYGLWQRHPKVTLDRQVKAMRNQVRPPSRPWPVGANTDGVAADALRRQAETAKVASGAVEGVNAAAAPTSNCNGSVKSEPSPELSSQPSTMPMEVEVIGGAQTTQNSDGNNGNGNGTVRVGVTIGAVGEGDSFIDARARSNANLRPFKPGQSGNVGGRPKTKIVRQSLMKHLRIPVAGKVKQLDCVVDSVIGQAVKGNVTAFTAIRDTVDGRPGPEDESANNSTPIQIEIACIGSVAVAVTEK